VFLGAEASRAISLSDIEKSDLLICMENAYKREIIIFGAGHLAFAH
jgi:hypothetical protein